MIERCFCLLTALALGCPALASSPEGACSDQPSADTPLRGNVSAEGESWQKHYQSGIKAYQGRLYVTAEKRLTAAEREAQRFGAGDARLIKSRTALAELYYAEGKTEQSEHLFNTNLAAARKSLGSDSLDTAQIFNGLAIINLAKGKFLKAEELSKQALAIRERILGKDSRDVGQTLHVLAVSLAKQAWVEEAEPLFRRSIAILEMHRGADDLDLADGLRDMALFYQAVGRSEESAKLFAKSLSIKENAIRLDLPPAIAGTINFPWDEGSPGSGKILDGEYPLRFITVGGLRVAVAVVESMQLLDVLISLKNTTDRPIDVGLGPVAISLVKPKLKALERLNPEDIDYVLEELTVWDWTHRQPSLAILQQNTIDPGQTAVRAPACKQCTGGNVFGRYGQWQVIGSALSRAAARTPIPTEIESTLQSGAVEWNQVRALNVLDVSIGPQESRTGLVYFRNPRYGEAILRIFVGNATFDFPVRLSGQQYPS